MSSGRLYAQHAANRTRNFARSLWLGVFALNVLAVGLAAYMLYSGWKSEEDRARAETQNLSLTLERQVAGMIEGVDIALKSLADTYAAMTRSNRYSDADWNAALLRQRAHLPILSVIRGVDEQGVIAYGLDSGDPQGATVADRSYFAAHRDHPDAGLVISRPVYARITQKWALVLARRLNDHRGRFNGIVAATVPLERIGEQFTSIRVGNSGVISMRDADMHLVLRLPPVSSASAEVGSIQIGKELADALRVNPNTGTYHNSGSQFDGVQRLHSYRRSEAYGFYINVGMAREAYLANWYRDTARVAGLILLFLLVTTVLARRLQWAWAAQESASARLGRSEADYRALADGAPYGVVVVDSRRAVSYVNPAYSAMLGYTLQDIPDLEAWYEKAYPDPDYRKSIRDSSRRWLLDREAPAILERTANVRRSDGAMREIRSMLVKMDDGRVTITCEDITDKARAERQLQDSRDQFWRVVEHSPLAMALISTDGAIGYINNKATEIFGYLPQEIPDMESWWVKAYPDPEYRAEVVSLWTSDATEARTLGREIEKREYRITCKDGSVKTVAVFGVWIGDRVLAIFEDVTERRKVQEAMQLAQQVFDTASEGIFVADLRGNITQANAAACGLAKYSHKEMVKLHARELVDPDDVPRIAALLAKCDAGVVVQDRCTLRCADGSTVPLDALVQRLPGDRYLATVRDLSERERMLAQLSEALRAAEAANAAKSRFLATASHDLRQPIQAINLFCAALTDTALSAEQKQISTYLSLSARNLADILNALLDISKFNAGAVKPAIGKVRCADFLRVIQAEFSQIARGQGLKFRIRNPGATLAVLADPALLHSLMANLVGNAIKYTERGGILIGLRRRGDHVALQVWDTGIGIAPEHLDGIFEEYFQVGNPERDKAKGLGLGLAIVRNLAGLLDTEVVCRSRQGKGSLFEFRLRVAEESAQAAPADLDGKTLAAALPNYQVVVVDDDSAVAAAIQLTLEARGMQVSSFASAEQALASPGIADADFYISDLRLPGLNGKELLDALQERSRTPIRAVILTGDMSGGRAEMAKSSQWPVLSKPFNLPELLSAMQSQRTLH